MRWVSSWVSQCPVRSHGCPMVNMQPGWIERYSTGSITRRLNTHGAFHRGKVLLQGAIFLYT